MNTFSKLKAPIFKLLSFQKHKLLKIITKKKNSRATLRAVTQIGRCKTTHSISPLAYKSADTAVQRNLKRTLNTTYRKYSSTYRLNRTSVIHQYWECCYERVFVSILFELTLPKTVRYKQYYERRRTRSLLFSGVCQCAPGWTGYDCGTVCPHGTFGIDCSSVCNCKNGASCRPTDGNCMCKPGFYGPTCSEGRCTKITHR